jgi:hypothetical protein
MIINRINEQINERKEQGKLKVHLEFSLTRYKEIDINETLTKNKNITNIHYTFDSKGDLWSASGDIVYDKQYLNNYKESSNKKRINMKNYKIYYTKEAEWVCDVMIEEAICCSGQGKTPQEALEMAIKFDNY